MSRNYKYSEITIHPHAHEMLDRISNATYIHKNHLVGMYIANEACLFDSLGRQAYLEQCETRFDGAEEMLVYFEPSDSEKHKGKLKLYQVYLAKLREIAWSINVRPKDFLNYVISAEFESFVNLNKESIEGVKGLYMRQLGRYRELMDASFEPLTTCIYKTQKMNFNGYTVARGNTGAESGFVPANKLKKQGGDSLL